MRLVQREDGTRVFDVQGYSNAQLQLIIRNFLDKMKPREMAGLVFDDPDSYEPIELALYRKGFKIMEKTARGGVSSLK